MNIKALELDTDRDLFGGLRDENFRRLMQICFNEADHFSLSKLDLLTYPSSVEDLLEPYLKHTIKTDRWFGYGGAPKLVELIYKANDETLKIITDCYSDIFLQKKNRIPKKKYEQLGREFLYPSNLENICFFKERKIFFGTVSHEYICAARSISETFESKLLELAPWRKNERDLFRMDTVELPK